MSYAFIHDVPIDMRVYQAIRSELGPETPEGLIVHIVVEREAGLRYIDVWQSREHWNRFVEERLHPALGRVFRQLGIVLPAVEPAHEPIRVTDVWQTSAP